MEIKILRYEQNEMQVIQIEHVNNVVFFALDPGDEIHSKMIAEFDANQESFERFCSYLIDDPDTAFSKFTGEYQWQ